jgi:Ca2+-binding EF-hand superfamily protein
MDKNADGVLTEDEMQRPSRGDGEKHRKGDRRGKMNPEKALERLDQDGSGGVTFDELQGKRFSPDSNAFAAADADGNGELNAAELKAMMKAQRAERRKADSDTDG